MKRISTVLDPLVTIDRRSSRPLHRQIYDGFRAAILRGELRGAQQVPSTRLLAQELGISRIPVISAYEELLSEGYFESRVGAGTFVSRSLPESLTLCEPSATRAQSAHVKARPVSRRGTAVTPVDGSAWIVGKGAFALGQPAYDQFPVHIWSKLVGRHGRSLRTSSLHYGVTSGRTDLRSAIATYLRSARAVHCEPEQILIVNGSQQAVQIAALALLDPGDRVWMEEPGYWLAQRSFKLAGARIVPVPVDDEGMNVAVGKRLSRTARLAFVTPSHQFPLGTTMSLPRRLQLLDWARTQSSWIVEDDYDSEYRYESKPIPSLQGLDSDARVIYVGTFSKVLFPSLRTGYMVVPADLLDRFIAVRQTIDVSQPDLNQAILAQFIDEGHFARHLRRMRSLYGERRATLEDGLRKHFAEELEILGAQCGMHLSVRLPKGLRDVEIAKRAAERNLWVWPLSSSYLNTPAMQGLMLGFGGVATQDILRGVRALRETIAVDRRG
jgi:GntR family transcriptional regulator/MocR family aminotransferase